ncbi:rhomboid family intramembrane serine protease [Hahella ganghwensis]|uniref:rhomboid family intramembrane serine protease n=1 Tax=Hahella ganghwensis TaxID=286420 RepID=UPI000379322C|nr:rhomboid family intramembrane serine protease [Hahella ganghwensis]
MKYASKNCPSCQESSLKHIVFMGENVLQCSICQGLWFDDGELNRAIAHHHEDIDKHCHKEGLGQHLGTSERQCRDCQKPLQHYHLLEEYQVVIDCCASCNGIWLDKEEVDQVLHSPKIREAIEKLNKKTSWRSWVFQALTQMPVEYNIPVKRAPVVTWGLIGLCIITFLIGFIDPNLDETLFRTFALSSETPGTAQFLMQFISYQFLHGGWLHLLGNMYFLWVVGDNLEEALGRMKFLGIYLVSGMVAGFGELVFQKLSGHPPLPLVGASGSVAALFGIYLIFFRYASLSFMIFVFQKKLSPVWYFVIWSGLNILGLALGDTGVAYVAHLSGFAFGILVGLALHSSVLERHPMIRMLSDPMLRVKR